MPPWVTQPARTVDNGYIVYVTEGAGSTLEQASFKSEAAGALDVANECSFAPKGVRVEDRFQTQGTEGFVVYTKTGLAFNDCEVAQAATDPADIKRLANGHLEAMVRKYEEMTNQAPLAQAAPATGAPPAPAAVPPAESTPPPAQTASPAPPPGVPTASAGAATANAGSADFATPEAYLVARQRVFYLKQQVILAPADAYPPGAPQTQLFVRSVMPITAQVHAYQVAHPGIHTWNHAWSTYRRIPHDEAFRRHPLVIERRVESHFPAPERARERRVWHHKHR